LGDAADDIYHWASGFCLALHGKTAPKVPRLILRVAGLAGDAIGTLTGKPFLTMERQTTGLRDGRSHILT
jgi:hypothetical protein